MRVVFDTSVLVAAARSRHGASYALVRLIPSSEFRLCLSVSLYTEWREVLSRAENLAPGRSPEDAQRFVRYLASRSHLQEIYFLWRPFLRDPGDEMVLELAFAAGCPYIVTHNVMDFQGTEELGITALSLGQFLRLIRKNA